MRTTIYLLCVVALGIAVGIGVAVLRVGQLSWIRPAEVPEIERANKPVAPQGPSPKVVVADAEHDVGMLVARTEGRRAFTLTNDGNAPLTLAPGETSGPCTLGKLEQTELAPGASTKVTVAWKYDGLANPFPQTATILTNDPLRKTVTLTISGSIRSAIMLFPSPMNFGYVPVAERAAVTAKLFCRLEQPLSIVDFSVPDAAVAQYFKVSSEPISPEQLKREDTFAKSGLLLTVALTPGLPSGPFTQKIILKTNLDWPSEYPIEVTGNIGSEIRVTGRGWELDGSQPNSGVLNLGTVSSKTGQEVQLLLSVRGPQRKETTFKVASVAPDLLKVSLGKTTEIDNGAVLQTPLRIEIPPESPLIQSRGANQGEIVIETTHPQIPKLRIAVRFTVGS